MSWRCMPGRTPGSWRVSRRRGTTTERYGRGSLLSKPWGGADRRLAMPPVGGMAVTTSGRSLVAAVDSMSRRADGSP